MPGKIIVVGLGAGDVDNLPLGTVRLLTSGQRVWLRTGEHPGVTWLQAEGMKAQPFDFVYKEESDFPAVYRRIVRTLLDEAQRGAEVVYAVPGHPMVAEATVRQLLDKGRQEGVTVEIKGGGSFLDPAFTAVGIDPLEGFQLLDGTGLTADRVDPEQHLFIAQVYDRMVASEVKLTLMEVFPDEHPVQVLEAAGVPDMERVETIPLWELDRTNRFGNLTTIHVPPLQSEAARRRRFSYLEEIVARLRAPDGCPWDRKQTHESLRPYLLEESYEFLEAVEKEDPDAMADELGDVLLQVLLHSQIAREEGTFDIRDVIVNLADKLIRRHPHVFGDAKAKNATEVKQKWEEIKREERAGLPEADSILADIPSTFPALARAFKLQKKAAKVGFDWPDLAGVRAKVEEELDELEAATADHREEELGDLLFTVVALARFTDRDPELALLAACRKFERRFRRLEEESRRAGRQLKDCTLEEMDAWWEQAKTEEAR
ncbi:nucleoside triphosphate pyrophosphohydrolase [Desmospora profundinema]|uniref:Tetrapyrrole methylase family protein/MazG family protein n=1 Tax=Desmospora profundinema TaxID=1571184 RepID=A0ABU1IQM7_9BACL|nr:nucleoside triphosphate pyrophosphohydrolase [Desmospora profundinema]MDR6227101.1 tetrapyrrole methylase family protein/MazG family protein [Desmospora profundinema]